MWSTYCPPLRPFVKTLIALPLACPDESVTSMASKFEGEKPRKSDEFEAKQVSHRRKKVSQCNIQIRFKGSSLVSSSPLQPRHKTAATAANAAGKVLDLRNSIFTYISNWKQQRYPRCCSSSRSSSSCGRVSSGNAFARIRILRLNLTGFGEKRRRKLEKKFE